MKEYKYYIAFCFQTKESETGFGNIVLTNKKEISIETEEDINTIEDFIVDFYIEKKTYIKNVTIMDFRELKG